MSTAQCKWLLLLPAMFSFINGKAQAVKHSYRFYNNLSVSAPQCGPDLTEAPAPGSCGAGASGGGFIQDTLPYCQLSRVLYHNNIHWGLQYPNTAGTVTNTYTIHLYLKNTNWGSQPWVRIIDFSNGASDAGIYFKAASGTPDRCLEFFPNGIVGACPYFNNSTYYLLTFTRNGLTNVIDVYVNNVLFTSYNDAPGKYTGTAGTPIYIYRDDQAVTCESGEANFAYLSFTNQYSVQATVDSVYNEICSIANGSSASFEFTPAQSCNYPENINVTYTGDIPPPGTGYSFNWNWDGGTVVSGSGMGPYTINWPTSGVKNVSLTIVNTNCATQTNNTQSILLEAKKAATITQSICQGQSYLGHTSSGTYTDTFVTASGCDSVRTLLLTVKPNAGTTISQSICQGQSFEGYSAAGTYKDTFPASNGCDSIRTLLLTVLNNPQPNLGPDRSFCTGDTVLLTPGTFNSYLWQDGSAQNHLVASQPGLYSVTVTGNCGPLHDEVLLTQQACNIEFPSAFTPNGDGINDMFGILNALNLQHYQLNIYNRWGQTIFTSANAANGWNGRVNGSLQPPGVYVWSCNYTKNGNSKFLRGTVVLVR
jgi:gliding motility-associated-like protein